MSLNLKYRPQSLEDFHGNADVVAAVGGLLASDSPPRAWLFSGPSGCGKTTLGRILAHTFDCAATDLVEINASDARGIDTARELIALCSSSPWGPARVVILDEVHQATKDFQNAILKLVEEPPAKTFIVLCTTDPERLLKTIRNRCQQFQLSPLSRVECLRFLRSVAKQEGVSLPKEVALKIHAAVEGCPRQALILLSRVLATDESHWEDVVKGFQSEEAETIDLCRALMKRAPWPKVAPMVKALTVEPESARRMILGYFTSVLLGGNVPHAAWVLECFSTPFYDTGKAGLALACYSALLGDDNG